MVKQIITRFLTLAACLIFLFWGLLTSSLRLWADVILSRTGDAIRSSHIVSYDRTMLFLAGNIYMRNKDCRTAVKTYESLIVLYPHYWDAKNNLAICLAVMGKSDDAKKEWEEILRQWPYYEAARQNLKEINKKSRGTKK